MTTAEEHRALNIKFSQIILMAQDAMRQHEQTKAIDGHHMRHAVPLAARAQRPLPRCMRDQRLREFHPMTAMDKKPLFMLARAADGNVTLVFTVPDSAFADAPNGTGFDFDLTKAGFPAYVVVFKSKDHADAMRQMEEIGRKLNIPILDERRKDFSIGPVVKQ